MSRRYALEFAPKALRALRKLDRPVVERIKAATESLRDDPRPAGAKMLTGMHGINRGSGLQVTTGSCTRSTMTGWWSWSWTPAIAGRSTVSVLAGGSERIRGLDHETAR